MCECLNKVVHIACPKCMLLNLLHIQRCSWWEAAFTEAARLTQCRSSIWNMQRNRLCTYLNRSLWFYACTKLSLFQFISISSASAATFTYNIILHFIQLLAFHQLTKPCTSNALLREKQQTRLIQLTLWSQVHHVRLGFFFSPPQTFVNPHYQGSLIPTYIILSVMAAWAYLCAGGSLRNLKLCLTCKDKDFLLANHRPR